MEERPSGQKENIKSRQAHEFGVFAEKITAEEYIKKGYVILERNWRMGKTEIDLIAQSNDTVIFIEVKARSGKDMEPIEAVTPDKKKRMTRAADSYIRNKEGEFSYRFDLVGVTGDMHNYSIEILEDAFLAADFF